MSALALATLSLQVSVVLLGVGQVCRGTGHKHGSVAEPDCPMHHQEISAASFEHAGHHGAVPAGDPTPRVQCNCSADALLFIGDAGIMAGPPVLRPSAAIATLTSAPAGSTPDQWIAPLSPPPRSYFS
jgi:hypothetical protein